MLLTLATRSLVSRLAGSPARDDDAIDVLDLPGYAIRHLQLRGMNVPASMLAGWSLSEMDALRDAADKAGCPCLVLIEDTPLAFADPDPEVRQAAGDRVQRLATAAQRLGCNALGISFEARDTDDHLAVVASEMKGIMPFVERMELNVLLAPSKGLTDDPQRLTDLIKRIGGFRIGSLPSFGHAAATDDMEATLRKLAPYAGAVHATINGFDKKGEHKGFDLAQCVAAIRSVGFVNTLAIDFTGSGDAVKAIERAREVLQQAIEAE